MRSALKELRAEVSSGVSSSTRYTVADAVERWLQAGLRGRDEGTVGKCRALAEKHLVPAIGAAKLRELTADDVDEWLDDRACELATSTLRELLSILRRSITLAQRRDLVARNVAELVTAPRGTQGRPSKALTIEQAKALLDAAPHSRRTVESIAHLVGHAGTTVTEAVYRKELRPVLTDGAAVIDNIFQDEAR